MVPRFFPVFILYVSIHRFFGYVALIVTEIISPLVLKLSMSLLQVIHVQWPPFSLRISIRVFVSCFAIYIGFVCIVFLVGCLVFFNDSEESNCFLNCRLANFSFQCFCHFPFYYGFYPNLLIG